jgi:tRNA(Ile)-lysidine synthase
MKSEFTLLNKVANFIAQTAMLTKERPVVVGLSGGADSMALLDVLATLGYRVTAAHCNFGLRGEESERDNRFVSEQCRRCDVELREVRFDTYGYIAAHPSCSLEMACRELRYAWFEQLLDELGAQAVAIAHHQDDSVETFFLNLLRGTGIAGLTGIDPVRGRVVRPLSCVSREEIEDYLGLRGIDFVTDSTNREDHFRRNKIRLHLIPLLKEITPAATDAVRRTMSHLHDAETVYAAAVASLRERTLTREGDLTLLSIAPLLASPAPEAMLFELLRPYGVSPVMCRSIRASLEGISGKQFYTDSHRIVKDRDRLIIAPLADEGDPCSELRIEAGDTQAGPLRIERITADEALQTIRSEARADKSVLYVDADKLRFPLSVRRWRQGDRFVPFGRRKSKMLSDYFAAAKYSLLDKERQLLLVDADDRILWLIGERPDDRFRLTPESEAALRIIFEPKKR